jgi:hypothetical protein
MTSFYRWKWCHSLWRQLLVTNTIYFYPSWCRWHTCIKGAGSWRARGLLDSLVSHNWNKVIPDFKVTLPVRSGDNKTWWANALATRRQMVVRCYLWRCTVTPVSPTATRNIFRAPSLPLSRPSQKNSGGELCGECQDIAERKGNVETF